MPRAVEPQYLYLTTTGRRSGLPREIEIWFTQRHGRYYLISEHSQQAHWVRNLSAEPRVRWRVGDVIFSGRARALDADAHAGLVQEIQGLSRRKYGWGDGLVVELTPDPPGSPSPAPAPDVLSSHEHTSTDSSRRFLQSANMAVGPSPPTTSARTPRLPPGDS